jgi:hypothetical protein
MDWTRKVNPVRRLTLHCTDRNHIWSVALNAKEKQELILKLQFTGQPKIIG